MQALRLLFIIIFTFWANLSNAEFITDHSITEPIVANGKVIHIQDDDRHYEALISYEGKVYLCWIIKGDSDVMFWCKPSRD